MANLSIAFGYFGYLVSASAIQKSRVTAANQAQYVTRPVIGKEQFHFASLLFNQNVLSTTSLAFEKKPYFLSVWRLPDEKVG